MQLHVHAVEAREHHVLAQIIFGTRYIEEPSVENRLPDASSDKQSMVLVLVDGGGWVDLQHVVVVH